MKLNVNDKSAQEDKLDFKIPDLFVGTEEERQEALEAAKTWSKAGFKHAKRPEAPTRIRKDGMVVHDKGKLATDGKTVTDGTGTISRKTVSDGHVLTDQALKKAGDNSSRVLTDQKLKKAGDNLGRVFHEEPEVEQPDVDELLLKIKRLQDARLSDENSPGTNALGMLFSSRENLICGIVMSEILGKPKALRNPWEEW
jgi:hypothetical protein